jgi:STE24 endopeptidase
MKAETIIALYLVFFFLEMGWENLLTLLNMRTVKRNGGRVPDIFAGAVDEETCRRSEAYTLDRNGFSILSGLFSSFFVLLMVLSGFLGRIDSLFAASGLHPYLQGILYVFAISLIFRLASLPFSLYSQFVIEERHGFNRMTGRLFAFDLIKGLLLSALLTFPLLWVLFLFMDAAGSLWWLWAFLFTAAFQLFVTLLYPLVIAPLFNKFSPLEEGSLKEKIVRLADLLSFKTKGIFIMDGSKRSRHSNAYFTGLGKVKRIVLFDTLIKSLTEDQITAVLAHEIGHEKKKHLQRMLLVSFSFLLAGFLVVNALYRYEPLFAAFGFSRASYHGILVILSFCSGPFTFFLTPLFTSFSRTHEYEADRYAAEAGFSKEMQGALLSLGKDNLTNLTPHPWYSFYHYSHPTLAERLSALRRIESAQAEL